MAHFLPVTSWDALIIYVLAMTLRRERFIHGNAHADRAPGDDFWSVSFGGAKKGTVRESEGLFYAVYLGHGVKGGVDCMEWPSLVEAIEALMEED